MSRKSKQDPIQMTLLDQIQEPRACGRCGGTILAPTVGGVPRGTCHCSSGEAERFTDWSGARVKPVVRGRPRGCCAQTIARYEALPISKVAMERHARGEASPVALCCEGCRARLTFVDGRWQREGEA